MSDTEDKITNEDLHDLIPVDGEAANENEADIKATKNSGGGDLTDLQHKILITNSLLNEKLSLFNTENDAKISSESGKVVSLNVFSSENEGGGGENNMEDYMNNDVENDNDDDNGNNSDDNNNDGDNDNDNGSCNEQENDERQEEDVERDYYMSDKCNNEWRNNSDDENDKRDMYDKNNNNNDDNNINRIHCENSEYNTHNNQTNQINYTNSLNTSNTSNYINTNKSTDTTNNTSKANTTSQIQSKDYSISTLKNKEEDVKNKLNNTQSFNKTVKDTTQLIEQKLVNNFSKALENYDLLKRTKTAEDLCGLNSEMRRKSMLFLCVFNLFAREKRMWLKLLVEKAAFKTTVLNYHDKLFQLDRLTKKYESILEEKGSIIVSKTDEIEELKEKIDGLNKQLKDASKKNKSLNVIPESLCAKCGRSLEESMCSESMNDKLRVIKEQDESIKQLKREVSDISSKNNLLEMRLKDLNEIKSEFEALSQSLLKPKNEAETQTEFRAAEQPKKNLGKNGARSGAKIAGKGNKKAQIQKKKITNFNIININNTTNNNNSCNNCGSTMTNFGVSDQVTSLRFDNSVLSNELLNLNKEFNKLRSEYKTTAERNSRLEKEKKDAAEKLKAKSDLYEKAKKENEELMILINNSKYKNVVNAETENKKLRSSVENLEKEVRILRGKNESNLKVIGEQGEKIEDLKKALETYGIFKQQKENLILANTKNEIELKRLKFDLETEKNLSEKNAILLEEKEKEIQKLKNEVSYYSFNIKKCKSDAERALQDAIGYQKIVRVLEEQINEYKEVLKKIKNKQGI